MTDANPTGGMPAEVVTEFKVRYFELPLGAGRAAMITMDNGLDHNRPNTFGLGSLESLGAALDEIGQQVDLAAVCLTGKPFIFAVGADLSGVPFVANREMALGIAEAGHAQFRRIAELDVPTFAFINGAAMGGGLEISLYCDYRTVSAGAAAIALPECFLGLVPGWGGTYLLPNLIGAKGAVKVIVENALNQNKMLKPAEVGALGIADAVFDSADYLEQSLQWAAGVLNGDVVVARAEVDKGDEWDAAVAKGRAFVQGKVGGAAPAPLRALDLIELAKTASMDESFAAEDAALADLIMSEELRAGLYSFDLVQKRAKRPVGVPDKSLARPVTKVGVVGAGLMASQMALLFAQRLQVPVALTDLDQERIDKGLAYCAQQIDGMVAKGRLSEGKANRLKGLISGSTDKAVFADADFVIEAVFEDLKVKKQVFAELEAVVRPDCVLATNTSSLSVTDMAADLANPERVVGFHFFNPVAVMPLVEIVRADQTDDATVATAFAVGKALKKSCVLVSDKPAFVVNRLLTRFMNEVTKAVDEGTDFAVADNALAPLGLPMTPFVLLQLVGPAVAYHVSETMHEAYPDRFYVSDNLARVVEARKGAIWSWDGGTQHVDPEVAALFAQGDSPLTSDEVRERATSALAEEIQIMLDEGVVAQAQDIDLCMIMGAGWPFHLGGITPYLDRSGVSERVNGKRFHNRGVASLPA